MSENASHVIVHHYLDGASSLYFSMVCCIILIVIVVIIVCCFLGFVIYVVVASKKTRQLSADRSLKQFSKQRENPPSRNLIEDPSSFNVVGTPVSSAQEFDMAAEANVQSIPLSTFRKHSTNDKLGGSTESAELYDVLFPRKHEKEALFKPPKKLVTFAGQVYASGESSSQTNLIPGPSTSRLACDNASGSLEWDYFQQNSQNNSTESIQSDDESETEIKQLQTICWV